MKCFTVNFFGSELVTRIVNYYCELFQWFDLEAALQTNSVTKSDVKEVMKKLL